MAYLIEPYNAYQKPPRKKHWMEIAEEEALYHKMAQDQIIREQTEQTIRQLMYEEAIDRHIMLREQSALQQQQNLALISQTPQPSSQQVQNSATVAGNSGAGGSAPRGFFNASASAAFTATPSVGKGPMVVQFTNLASPEYLQFGNFTWDFGDGKTSNTVNPLHIYNNTGSYTVTLSGSGQYNSSLTSAIGSASYISSSLPVVSASFTSSIVTGPIPLTITFINTSTNNSQIPTTTYFWSFGSASLTSTLERPTFTYTSASVYTVILQTTGSYPNVTNVMTKTAYISASIT